MSKEPIDSTQLVKHSHMLPGEWALEKILGPTFDQIGDDIQSLYVKGIKLVTDRARKKIVNLDDGARANLRVSRDVFFNGSFSDDEISAEYFGGVLAASRSLDGKDDKAIFYLDIIKSLSSTQLKLHYLIFSALNSVLLSDKSKIDFNPARSDNIGAVRLFFLTSDFARLGINVDSDLWALHNKGLLNEFEYSNDIDPDKVVNITRVTPTTLGVQLYAISCNMFEDWRKISTAKIDNFQGVAKPSIVTDNEQELLQSKAVIFEKARLTRGQ